MKMKLKIFIILICSLSILVGFFFFLKDSEDFQPYSRTNIEIKAELTGDAYIISEIEKQLCNAVSSIESDMEFAYAEYIFTMKANQLQAFIFGKMLETTELKQLN